MSRASHVAEPGQAPPVTGVATGKAPPPFETPAYPFDAGPYDRLPPPLGVTSTNPRIVGRRALIAVLLAWVPLAGLSAWDGLLLADNPRESFLLDVAVHARYLIALPLLVLAERTVLPRLGEIVRQFMTSGLVPAHEHDRFTSLVASTRRLLDSPLTMIIIVAVAYSSSLRASELLYPADLSTWPAPIVDGERARSMAGWWRAIVSQPMYLSILGLWFFRAFLWARFVFKVSRLDLRLVASHPDLMGGLRFVLHSVRAFPIVAFAMATAMAGNVALSVLIDGRSLSEFVHVVVVAVVFVAVLFIGPPLSLRGPLWRLRYEGIRVYGELASDLGYRFERRWLRPGREIPDEAMDATDFSAVTDAYSIVANANGIKLLPIDFTSAVPVVLATLLPFVPLVIATVPVADVLQFVANVLL